MQQNPELTESYFSPPQLVQMIQDNHALGRWGQPQDVVACVDFLISAAAGLVTGANFWLMAIGPQAKNYKQENGDGTSAKCTFGIGRHGSGNAHFWFGRHHCALYRFAGL
jgi:hypothetical protein